ncbi:MAG: hypothetical protein K8F30_12205 [Taibaiella sp.]|nr:hypothetical protein [Taibaiella sp.]
MIEVFKTNVSNPQQADELIGLLHHILPGSTINFDLEDCDRVLRIVGPEIATGKVIELLSVYHYECAILS